MRTAISATMSRVSRPIGFLTAAALVAILGTASPTEAGPCVGYVALVAADLGATCDDGTAPIGIFGTVLAADSSGYQTFPLAPPDYSYATPSGLGLAAGDVTDFEWVHEASAFGSTSGDPAGGAKWLFPFAASEFILYPSIDHLTTLGTAPEEGLEGTLWGSSDGGTTWALGNLVHIWEDGFHPGSIDDDYASLWRFTAPVDRISATHGLVQLGYEYLDGDVEIDAIAIHQQRVPEPGMLFLLGSGLAAALARRRRR